MILVVQKSGPIDSPINFRVSSLLFEIMGMFDAGVDSPDTIVIAYNTTDNNIALALNLLLNVHLEIIPPDPQIVLDISKTVVTIIVNDDGRHMCIIYTRTCTLQ